MQNCYEVFSVQGHMLHKGRGSEGLTPGSDPGSLGGVRERASAQGSGAGKEGAGMGQMASEEVRTWLADLLGMGVEQEFKHLLNK